MVIIKKTFRELEDYRKGSAREASQGFVPTMGNLHAGHLSLLDEALKHHQKVYFSIFVNPKQFGPQEDFQTYPRTLEEDIQKIQEVMKSPDHQGKTVIIFAPQNPEEIFPPGFSTTISVGELSRIFCGKVRPGHFDGVTTVVYRLFNLVGAHCAYFGQKDFQQTVVIQKMITDLNIPTQMKVVPTVRDSKGLALSSRNQYLSAVETQNALELYQTLSSVAAILKKGPWEMVRSEVETLINQVLKNPSWEYLDVREQKDLSPPKESSKDLVVLGALRMGKTRLIDNLLVTMGTSC